MENTTMAQEQSANAGSFETETTANVIYTVENNEREAWNPRTLAASVQVTPGQTAQDMLNVILNPHVFDETGNCNLCLDGAAADGEQKIIFSHCGADNIETALYKNGLVAILATAENENDIEKRARENAEQKANMVVGQRDCTSGANLWAYMLTGGVDFFAPIIAQSGVVSRGSYHGNASPVDIPNGISYVEAAGPSAGWPVTVYGVALTFRMATNRCFQILIGKGTAATTTAQTLADCQKYLHLFDATMTYLTEQERWLVDKHYLQGLSLSVVSEMPRSPYAGMPKSTLWRSTKKILRRADDFIFP